MIARRGQFVLTWRIVLPAALKHVGAASLYVGLFVLVPAVEIEVVVIVFPKIIDLFSTLCLDTFCIFGKLSHTSCLLSIPSLNCIYLRSCYPYITEINEFTFINPLNTELNPICQ